MHCPTCDTRNPDDARFCTGCGAALVPASGVATAPLGAAPMLAAPQPPVAAPGAAPVAHSNLESSATQGVVPPASPFNQTINVNVQAAPAPVVVMAPTVAGPGCLVRGLYFLFIGLWLGAIWTGLAWALLVSVIGLPLGLLMLNRLPQVMTLKPIGTQMRVINQGGVVLISQGQIEQRPFWLRALYFVLVGWWLSGLWLFAAWSLISVTFGLGLPLAFWMFDQTPAIVSLARQ
ncbi:MAG: zinc ribbon domain-containing protein [Oscillochloridaceae bacterium]|nr:zinc ribbon domain-containing protein [Chloroflexaceae bacterium]MDW8388680.1 zinc ribbon domain-containing protein [Oscillochloridaceae bacterium]